MQKDKSRILRIIDRLVEKHYVVRSLGDKDRRCKYLSLTEKGRDTFETASELELQVQALCVKGLTSNELKALKLILDKIREKSNC